MSHWQRIVLSAMALAGILFLIVILTQMGGPLFDLANSEAVGDSSNPFHGALSWIQDVAYVLIVPIFALGYLGWLIFGPAQDELQKERQRRRRPPPP